MSDTSKVFISHTTRDKRDHALAMRLADGLRDCGSEVWIAPSNIPAGSEWEEQLVSAIVSDCSHFLVILSAASTTAEWVLAEIHLAAQRHANDASFAILPLVVGTTAAFAGKDFLDRFQQIPYHDNFSDQLEAVVHSLPTRPAVPSRFIELTRNFVGRAYVFTAIDDFFRASDRGYFLVVGDPGEGKSAILAEYVKRTGCVAYFNVRAEGRNRTGHCLEAVHAQLVARYGLSLGSPPTEPDAFGEHWNRLLQQASTNLEEGSRLVIAIDALDEVDLAGHPAGANILFLPRVLPERVYLVMTRRRVKLPFVTQSPQKLFDLLDHRDESLVDIRNYIDQETARVELGKWVDLQGLTREKLTIILAEKSELNFMYLHYVIPEIANGAYQTTAFDSLPQGLRGYYDDHWERMGMCSDPLPQGRIRIVYVMAEARRPVSRRFIGELSGEDAVVVQLVIDGWREFLHEQRVDGETRYSVYHMSFLDFLHDKEIVQAAGESIESVHAAIADKLWHHIAGGS